MLPPTTVPNSATSTSSTTTQSPSASSGLPAAGSEIQAVVRSVASGDTSGQVFRIQVEANNRLLELITRAPLSNGDRINLSRSPSGELQIQLPTQSNPQTQTPANTGANLNRIVLNVAQQNSAQIMQSLPLNTPRQAQVMQSTPMTASPQPAPASSGSGAPTPTPGTPSNSSPPGSSQAGPSQGGGSSASAANVSSNVNTAKPTPAAPAQTAGTTNTSSQAAPTQSGTASSAPPQAQGSAQAQPQTPPASSGPAANNPPAAKAVLYQAQISQINAMPTPAPTTATASPPSTPASTNNASQAPGQAATSQTGGTANATQTPAPSAGSSAGSPQANTTSGSGNQVSSTTGTPQSQTQGQASTTTTGTRESTTGAPTVPLTQKSQQLARSLSMQQPVAKPVQHQVQLSLAGERINLISPRPLMVGQQVLLTRTDNQQVSLSPLPQLQTPVQSSVQLPAVQQALRDALPQQIPFGDALNQLVQLSQSPAARNQSAVNQLVQSMLSLFGVSPGSEDAGEAVKRNLQQGGLLTEARLGQPGADKAAPQADLKQQLGQLLKAAEQLPEGARQQMTRLVDALQARSTSQQVSSLQAWKDQPDGSMERVYRLDLPIRQAERFDNAELTITERRERQPDGDMLSLWNAALHFDLDEHGSVDARLSLQEGWRLQLQFWAEEPQTQTLINTRLAPFTDTLHQQGFLVENVQVLAGRPSQPELTTVQRRLVDVHT